MPSVHLARADRSQAVGRALPKGILEPVRQIAAVVAVHTLAACSQMLAAAAVGTDQIAAAGRVAAGLDICPEEQSRVEAVACQHSRLRGYRRELGLAKYGA